MNNEAKHTSDGWGALNKGWSKEAAPAGPYKTLNPLEQKPLPQTPPLKTAPAASKPVVGTGAPVVATSPVAPTVAPTAAPTVASKPTPQAPGVNTSVQQNSAPDANYKPLIPGVPLASKEPVDWNRWKTWYIKNPEKDESHLRAVGGTPEDEATVVRVLSRMHHEEGAPAPRTLKPGVPMQQTQGIPPITGTDPLYSGTVGQLPQTRQQHIEGTGTYSRSPGRNAVEEKAADSVLQRQNGVEGAPKPTQRPPGEAMKPSAVAVNTDASAGAYDAFKSNIQQQNPAWTVEDVNRHSQYRYVEGMESGAIPMDLSVTGDKTMPGHLRDRIYKKYAEERIKSNTMFSSFGGLIGDAATLKGLRAASPGNQEGSKRTARIAEIQDNNPGSTLQDATATVDLEVSELEGKLLEQALQKDDLFRQNTATYVTSRMLDYMHGDGKDAAMDPQALKHMGALARTLGHQGTIEMLSPVLKTANEAQLTKLIGSGAGQGSPEVSKAVTAVLVRRVYEDPTQLRPIMRVMASQAGNGEGVFQMDAESTEMLSKIWGHLEVADATTLGADVANMLPDLNAKLNVARQGMAKDGQMNTMLAGMPPKVRAAFETGFGNSVKTSIKEQAFKNPAMWHKVAALFFQSKGMTGMAGIADNPMMFYSMLALILLGGGMIMKGVLGGGGNSKE